MLGPPRGRLAAVLLTLAVTISVCSCSSSASSGHSASPEGSGSATAPTRTGSAAGTATPSGSPADAATAAAVRSAYAKLFAPHTPIAESVKVLQDGPKFRAALIAQSKSPLAKQSSAKATRVMLISPDTATVTFSVLISGSPILKAQTGYAVRQEGTWKVADKTFCGLLTLNGDAPAACKSPTATTLPG